MAILFVTSYNCIFCCQSLPVQILGILRLACPRIIHMKGKSDTGRYRLRFIIYTNVLAGIEAADRQLLEMAEVFLIPVGRRIRYIYLPQVIPFFRSGCMVALGLCWKSGIAAEVIGPPSGSIGEHLQQAKIYLDMPDLFAWTLVIVLVSLAFEKTVLALLSWTAKRLERM